MQSSRSEAAWSPLVENIFLLWNSNLQLYQVQEISEKHLLIPSVSRRNLNETLLAELIATKDVFQNIRCVKWYPGKQDSDVFSHLVAVGQSNGKVLLTNFSNTETNRPFSREFISKSRCVNTLSWNHEFSQFLAVGLDKDRGKEPSIYVFDVNRTPLVYNQKANSKNPYSETLQSVHEWSLGETVHSLEFSRKDPQTLIAGTSSKLSQIKLYDFRQQRSVNASNTSAIYGICCDPFFSHRFASYHEDTVHIWDIRNFERPVLKLAKGARGQNIIKLAWCPTRIGFLSCLSRESSLIKLYDIQEQGSDKEDYEPAVIHRYIPSSSNISNSSVNLMSPSASSANFASSTSNLAINNTSSAILSSFSWHPFHENRVLTVNCNGDLRDEFVYERVTLNWNVKNTIVWSSGRKSLHFFDQCNENLMNDISCVIRNRAVNGYGLEESKLSLNGTIAKDHALIRLWHWVEQANNLVSNNLYVRSLTGHYRYHGVLTLINSMNSKSEIVHEQWHGTEGDKHVYISEERSVCLRLCAWNFDNETTLDKYLDQLTAKKLYSRAAAMAIFNLELSKAIKILQQGAMDFDISYYNTLAMALAGYTNDRKTIWRETCSSLQSQIPDAYLRIIFGFLTDESDSFESILNENEISIHDRVGFACKFLDDSRLTDFLQSAKNQLVQNGHLDALLLTGLNNTEGDSLLQRYIDMTCDVQTVALLIIHTGKFFKDDDETHKYWVKSYLTLLDSLELNQERVQTEILYNSKNSKKTTLSIDTPDSKNSTKSTGTNHPQILVSCNFCLKNISGEKTINNNVYKAPVSKQTGATKTTAYDKLFISSNKLKNKLILCPNPHCRRPLPRCALCLQRMGTPVQRAIYAQNAIPEDSIIPSAKQSVDANRKYSTNQKKVGNWFTWCHACRHGGHALHITQWFKEQSECPVATCTCKCLSMDHIENQHLFTKLQ